MKDSTLDRIAYRLACRDVAVQAKTRVGENYLSSRAIDLEAEATKVYEAQYAWYIQRAARLWRTMQ